MTCRAGLRVRQPWSRPAAPPARRSSECCRGPSRPRPARPRSCLRAAALPSAAIASLSPFLPRARAASTRPRTVLVLGELRRAASRPAARSSSVFSTWPVDAHELRLRGERARRSSARARSSRRGSSASSPSSSMKSTSRGRRKTSATLSPFWVCLSESFAVLGLVVPGVAAGERRVAAAVHPLVEEPVEVAAGGVLDGALEVGRDDVVAATAVDVVADRLPEQRRRRGTRSMWRTMPPFS